MDEIFAFVGKIIAIGGSSAAVAYALFVFVGRKWMETKFAERLEAFKHEQTKELEQLRYSINSQFNRITKIHEKEIEVLPELWRLLQHAVAQLHFFISPGRSYPNLDSLNQVQLEEFLEGTEFQEWEKDEIRSAEKKVNKYQERIYWYELHDAKQAANEFHRYFQNNTIFLSLDLKEHFSEIDTLIWEAMINKQSDHEIPNLNIDKKSFTEVHKEISPLVEGIEKLVQKRLRYEEA